MVLATTDADGAPNARTVLLRGVDQQGFSFYTNRESAKGRELARNPRASLVFPWIAIHRQVVVRGDAAPLDDADSDGTGPRARVNRGSARSQPAVADRALTGGARTDP